MSPYVWDLFQACSTRAEIEWLYWNSFSYGDRSLGISDVCIFAVLARSTAPLLLLPSVGAAARVCSRYPRGPNGCAGRAVAPLSSTPQMPMIYRSATPSMMHMGTVWYVSTACM